MHCYFVLLSLSPVAVVMEALPVAALLQKGMFPLPEAHITVIAILNVLLAERRTMTDTVRNADILMLIRDGLERNTVDYFLIFVTYVHIVQLEKET